MQRAELFDITRTKWSVTNLNVGRDYFYMTYDFKARIDTLVDDFDLSDDVRDSSHNLLEKMQNRENFLRKFMLYGGYDAAVGITVYTAAHQDREPVEMQKLVEYMQDSEEFEVTKHFYEKKVRESVRKVRRELGLENVVLTPQDYLKRHRKSFDSVSDDTWDFSLDIARADSGFDGKSPKAVAAACFYIASVVNSEEVTQKTVQDLFGVSEVAIRYTYKDVLESVSGVDTDGAKLKDLNISRSVLGI